MALASKKYEKFYETTGTGADKVDATSLTTATNAWALEKAEGCKNYMADPLFGPLIYQLQQMQDELDALRSEISTNKDKATFPGFGTSSTTALAGDTTTISTSQASAITANTAKVSFEGGTSTALSFGDLITVPSKIKGGKPTYEIVMTATQSGVSKSITLTLV